MGEYQRAYHSQGETLDLCSDEKELYRIQGRRQILGQLTAIVPRMIANYESQLTVEEEVMTFEGKTII